ncbi:hypothetical protein BDW02DRAFT_647827 [Decorospora gaudefroyi]|uniref:Uncharacterized protein n=1 Tax=Decorospora gaudefroyi TaxID=184978 RepID=A0A6A5KD37_9PLEO|nr:hypothetical protein BDW02DRAFT_647827 [Decorospora gaudefroyi]
MVPMRFSEHPAIYLERRAGWGDVFVLGENGTGGVTFVLCERVGKCVTRDREGNDVKIRKALGQTVLIFGDGEGLYYSFFADDMPRTAVPPRKRKPTRKAREEIEYQRRRRARIHPLSPDDTTTTLGSEHPPTLSPRPPLLNLHSPRQPQQQG